MIQDLSLSHFNVSIGAFVNIKFENTVSFPYEFVIKNIGREMFLALNPPWSPMKLLKFDGTKVSDEVHLELNLGLKTIPWVSKIVKSDLNDHEFNFVDIGVKIIPGLTSWHHQHIFRKVDSSTTLIIDDIFFETSNSALDLIYVNLFRLQFIYRKFAYGNFLKSC